MLCVSNLNEVWDRRDTPWCQKILIYSRILPKITVDEQIQCQDLLKGSLTNTPQHSSGAKSKEPRIDNHRSTLRKFLTKDSNGEGSPRCLGWNWVCRTMYRKNAVKTCSIYEDDPANIRIFGRMQADVSKIAFSRRFRSILGCKQWVLCVSDRFWGVWKALEPISERFWCI